ncbi:hypothetical protein ACFLTX_04010, partial [Chloroflexota bacterium]
DVLAIDARGNTTNRLIYKDISLSELAAFHVIGQPSVFMRKSILDQAGYLDVSYHFLLDHHLWLRMAQLAEILHISGMLSAARFHAESKNVSQAAQFGKEVFHILDWMETQPGLTAILRRDRTRIRAGAHRLAAFYLLDGGDAKGSLREYAIALRLDPPTVLHDWRHLFSAFFSLLGLDRLSSFYRNVRKFVAGRRAVK